MLVAKSASNTCFSSDVNLAQCVARLMHAMHNTLCQGISSACCQLAAFNSCLLEQVCAGCRVNKPSSEFYTNKTAADMLHSLCKQCHGDKCRSRASGSYEVSVVDKVKSLLICQTLQQRRKSIPMGNQQCIWTAVQNTAVFSRKTASGSARPLSLHGHLYECGIQLHILCPPQI